ncbi:uncharacterized protein ColSpa_07909 [Colletotrichum spaethianum]|uniref:Secreted protein n=1 Tax=Colletotrichum spaethianum TaxID=700344 RepID=A0AA37P8R5_9PEZI|nr:uncharacterized protein ColSpa_07909 [Colletotrichum spaethianum]GKT47728.1 hypothetical protein ColSpa_07909 [Colletotrichum spaethianum]
MKFYSLALLVPFVSAACIPDQDHISIEFMRSTFSEYETQEFCLAPGSCVNMQSVPDSWAQKANWIIMKGNTCVTFYK